MYSCDAHFWCLSFLCRSIFLFHIILLLSKGLPNTFFWSTGLMVMSCFRLCMSETFFFPLLFFERHWVWNYRLTFSPSLFYFHCLHLIASEKSPANPLFLCVYTSFFSGCSWQFDYAVSCAFFLCVFCVCDFWVSSSWVYWFH
jgi:hypothetical protein